MIARAPDLPPAERPGVVVPLGFSGDDAALVAALREQHPGAKAAFFQRFAPYVERVITRVVGFDADLADIIQETFLKALGSLSSLRDPASLRPWLARVAALTARKVLRTRSRRRWLRLFVDEKEEARWERSAAEYQPDAPRALRAVYDILDELPTDERIAFSLRFIEGMDLSEVAAATAVSLATTKRRLRRAEERFIARAQGRAELEDWLAGGSRWNDT